MAILPMDPRRDLIGIGASAGGIEAFGRLLPTLPRDLPAAVALVLHLGPQSSSSLPALLARCGPLPAEYAQDGVELRPGRIYVAPVDLHMVVEGDRLRLFRGPRQNHVRPAIDPLFRSAARERGCRFVGVILSGMLDDGSAGLVAVRRAGGVAVVQDPADALFREMPQNALDLAGADHCVGIVEMGQLLERLVREPVREVQMRAGHRASGNGSASDVVHRPAGEGPDGTPLGMPSLFSCPDCGGVLFESAEDGQLTCRVGHAYSPEALLVQDVDRVEEALWAGLRALEESSVLARRLERRTRARMQEHSAARFGEQADEAAERARVLRGLLQGTPPAGRRRRSRAVGEVRARTAVAAPKRRR
jgi:two-component system chemotaxis response regulator CheB